MFFEFRVCNEPHRETPYAVDIKFKVFSKGQLKVDIRSHLVVNTVHNTFLNKVPCPFVLRETWTVARIIILLGTAKY